MGNDFNVKVTKTQLLKFVNNEMTTNWYYLVYIRIYNKDNTRYKKAKFIALFDSYDIVESCDSDTYIKKDVKNYLYDIAIPCFTDYINSFVDTKQFYKACNDSLSKY